MRSIVASLMVVGTVACDLNEGPAEERREAEEAVLEGQNPDRVQNELEDVDGVAAVDGAAIPGDQTTTGFDRELDQAEAWLADARREIEAGTRSANAATKDALDAVEKDIKEARADLGRLADQADTERQKLEADIRQAIAEIEATTSRLDAAGEPGDP